MAREGMRFTQHYAGSTVCAPSRAVLLTGLHTGHTSIKGNGDLPLKREETTLGKVLKKKGYATGIIGKWGLGTPGTTGTPDKNGFDYFFGYLHHVHAHNHFPDYLFRNKDTVALQNIVEPRVLSYTKEQGGVAIVKKEYANDLFTSEALSFIRKNQKKPFFLYLAYTIPHANNEADPSDQLEVPDDKTYSKYNWAQEQKNKAAMITRMDTYIGSLFNTLKELKLDKNTLVIFTSDNGPHREGVDPEFFNSNGELRGIKRDLYEGGIRVPMITWMPGKIQARSVTDHISAFWDVMPTLADLVEQPLQNETDGISFLPVLFGKGNQKQHQYLYWQFNEGLENYAVRSNQWKLIKYRKRKEDNFTIELYDLEHDISEESNVASQYPELVAKLLAYIDAAKN